MPARPPLFQTVFTAVQRCIADQPGLGKPVATRLATFITAMAVAQTTVLCQLAAQVTGLGLTRTTVDAHAERSLRNILNDARLTHAAVYQPILADVIAWDELRQTGEPAVLIIDESNRNATEHLLRISLAFWGDALPLAERLWVQNAPLEAGVYWTAVDALLAEVAQIVPPDLLVVFLADRAYDIPPFLDRITAHADWHYVVRLKANSSVCFRDPRTGGEGSVAELLGAALWGPGARWKGELDLFKNAKWRRVTVETVWEKGQKEPLALISDLPRQTDLGRFYDQRFWIEPSFKHGKSGGLQWEDSGVVGVAHHNRLLVAMAWVTLLALTKGLTVAAAQLARRNRQERRGWTVHAKHSVFRLGLPRLRGALLADAPPLALRLTHLSGPSWNDRYKQAGIPPGTFRP